MAREVAGDNPGAEAECPEVACRDEILRLGGKTLSEDDLNFAVQLVTLCRESAGDGITPPSLGYGCTLRAMQALPIKCYERAELMVESIERLENTIRAKHPELNEREVMFALMEAERNQRELWRSEYTNPGGFSLDRRVFFNHFLSWSVPKSKAVRLILHSVLPEVRHLEDRNILGVGSGNGLFEALIAYICDQDFPDFKVIATDAVDIALQEKEVAKVLRGHPDWFSTLMQQSYSIWRDDYAFLVNKKDVVDAAASVRGHVLVASWPPQGSSIVVAANKSHYNVFGCLYEFIIYVGEDRNGCTGSDEMFEMFSRYYVELQRGSCNNWK